jgi:hypothetical protein
LLCLVLLCSSAQATNLLISVQDSYDNTTIPSATVFLNGANIGRTNNYGQFFITHGGLNDQLIRVSMTGYNDWEKTIAKNETTVLVNLSRKDLSLKVTLYDSDTLLPVSGATVDVTAHNATQTKLTDVAGTATFGVKATTLYSIDVSAANYQPRSGTIDMGTENKEVQYWLLSGNRFSILVKDKTTKKPVQDAEVRIDTFLAGKTDERGILITPISRGKVYTIEIKKPEYQTVTESRMISDTDALYSIEITKAAIGAFIYVFDEKHVPLSAADVYINGTLSGATNQYGRISISDLVSGPYLVEIKKPGYGTISREISVGNKVEDFTFDMPYENSDLTIYVLDKDQKVLGNTTITIDGNAVGKTDNHGQYVTKVKFDTIYNVTASKEGYGPSFVQRQVIRGNATDSVTIVLEKNLDWSLITVIILGAFGVLVLFAVIRVLGRRRRRRVIKRNEI